MGQNQGGLKWARTNNDERKEVIPNNDHGVLPFIWATQTSRRHTIANGVGEKGICLDIVMSSS